MDLSDAVNVLKKADTGVLQKYSQDLRDIVAKLGEPVPNLLVLGYHVVSVKTTGEDSLDDLIENGSGDYSINVERVVTFDNGWTITIKIEGIVDLYKCNKRQAQIEWDQCNVDIVLNTFDGRYAGFSDITETLYSIVEKYGPYTFLHIFDDLWGLVSNCVSATTSNEIDIIMREEREKLEEYIHYNIGPLD